jgi:2-methylcitrate dehydratase PrpD
VVLDNIERVDGRVRGLAANLIRTRHPKSGLETKFSYFHAMAAAFVDGAAFPAQFEEPKAFDPAITSLRDRIELEADPSLPGRSAVVTLRLKDGRSYVEHIDHPTGNPERPMTDDDISAKFRALADGILPRTQAEELLGALWNVEGSPNVRDVMRLATAQEVAA